MTGNIKKYLDDGEIVWGVFINLEKAFDTVNHEVLLERLKHYGIRSKQWSVLILSYQQETIRVYGGFLFSNKNS